MADQISPRRRLPIRVRLAKYIVDWIIKTDSWASWQAAVWIICSIVIGEMFGAIHCLAWNAHFPTHIESKLWRVSAVIVTAAPNTGLLFGMAVDQASGKWGNTASDFWVGSQSVVVITTYTLLSLKALPIERRLHYTI